MTQNQVIQFQNQVIQTQNELKQSRDRTDRLAQQLKALGVDQDGI